MQEVVKLIDSYTGEVTSYYPITEFEGGGAVTDADVDGVIIRKKGSTYYKRAFTGPVNVKWFGAKGDGVTDDTAALQKATTACENLRRTLLLSRGAYNITDSIVINIGYFTISGEEDNSSYITYSGDGAAFIIGSRETPPTFGTAAYYLNFKNFQLTGTDKIGTTGILGTFRYGYIQNVQVKHFDTGIDLMFSWTNKYENVRVTGRINKVDPTDTIKYGTGIKTGVQCNSNSYLNCNIADCDTGILFTGGSSQNFNFSGGQIENCTTYAIKVATNNQLRGLTIIANYFENPGIFFSCIDNSGVSGLVLEGNHTATRGDGLALEIASTSGRVVGIINANTFTRVANTIDGQFVRLTTSAYVNLQNNQGYNNDASYTSVEILTDDTLSSSDSRYFTRTDTVYPHRINTTGTVQASKGFIVGSDTPFSYSAGMIVYDSNAKLFHYYIGNDATGSNFLQTTQSGTTAQRPTITRSNQMYFDTTLGKPIWAKAAGIWVDATGTTV